MLKRRSFLALGTVSALAFGAPVAAQTTSNAVRASSPGGVLTIRRPWSSTNELLVVRIGRRTPTR